MTRRKKLCGKPTVKDGWDYQCLLRDKHKGRCRPKKLGRTRAGE